MNFLFQRSTSGDLPATSFLKVFSFSWLEQKSSYKHLFNQGPSRDLHSMGTSSCHFEKPSQKN